MALLICRAQRFNRVLAAALFALLAAGCAVLGSLRRDSGSAASLRFSHALHVLEEELSCENCHEDAAMSDQPGMPSMEMCVFCHAEIDEEKPLERRIETLFEDEVFIAQRRSALADEQIFSHLTHVDADLECGVCHVGIEASEFVDGGHAVPMSACIQCHDETGQPNDCATCHQVLREDVAPPSHALAWTKRHGVLARDPAARRGTDVNSCSLCHTEASCVDCHRQQAPDNHRGHWRLRGHGIVARLDRENCATCHQSHDCDACHAETLPRSHTGVFGGTTNTHCFGCHFPLRSNACSVCHQDTSSHRTAPPKPDWHTPQMDCRQCHGLTVPLRHVDNGANCNLCHS